MMLSILGDMLDKVPIFVDDSLPISNSLNEHVRLLEEVFRNLDAAGLKLRRSKCAIAVAKVVFLGHELLPGEYRPRSDN